MITQAIVTRLSLYNQTTLQKRRRPTLQCTVTAVAAPPLPERMRPTIILLDVGLLFIIIYL